MQIYLRRVKIYTKAYSVLSVATIDIHVVTSGSINIEATTDVFIA